MSFKLGPRQELQKLQNHRNAEMHCREDETGLCALGTVEKQNLKKIIELYKKTFGKQ